MANLKDLLVNGAARIVGKVYSNGGFVGNLDGTASNASKVNNLTVQTAVPANAKFTDTNTWNANSVNVAGYVAAPTASNANKVWKTDASGNPAWRSEDVTAYNLLASSANLSSSSYVLTIPNNTYNAYLVEFFKADETFYVSTVTHLKVNNDLKYYMFKIGTGQYGYKYYSDVTVGISNNKIQIMDTYVPPGGWTTLNLGVRVYGII